MMTTYQVERIDTNCKVSVNGSLTAILVPVLKEALNRELQQETHELVFDLKQTTMLDSSGIGLLIATSNTLKKTGTKLRVINPAEQIFELLGNMRLLSRLNVTAGTNQR